LKWFDTYVSNTLGGTGNQVHFGSNGSVRTGRIYYKVFAGGKYRYSLLFSNTIDSTYKPEYHSQRNLVCDEWEILDAGVCVCKDVDAYISEHDNAWVPLTFGGKSAMQVMPGGFFTSDPVELDARKGEYLCVQITFRGDMIPYHLESVLPTFVQSDGGWIPDKKMPVPSMIGCDRKVTARVGFLGDSITQGIGTPKGMYTHWNALVSDAIGEAYSYWNLGLGYGRAQDAASDGAWLFKAKQMDAVVLAYGSNDIGRGRTLEQMKADFTTIVDRLHAAGVKVFLLSVPPFDWKKDYLERWYGINRFCVDELSRKADEFLDIAPLLTDPKEEGKAIYGTHPNEEGCRIWAEALTPLLSDFLRQLK